MRHCSPESPPIVSADLPAPRMLAALTIAAFLGCTARPLGDGETDDTGPSMLTLSSTGSDSTGPIVPTSGGPTGDPSPTTGNGDSSGTSVMDTGVDTQVETGCPFICAPDLPPNNEDCPGTQQLDPECPDGFKCTIEGSLGDTQCIEIVPNPKGLYEPCTLMGDGFSGIDDCGLGMLCWNVDEQGQGICFGLCDGPIDGECICADASAMPTWCQECAVGLCIPGCDPLIQDCISPDDACYPVLDGFLCAPDASGDTGQANDPCEFINTCEKGLACVEPALASAACDPQGTGCCQPFCELPGGVCPNPDQACTPWFEPGQAPPGHEDVGICLIAK